MASIVIVWFVLKFPDEIFRIDSTFAFESWNETLLTDVVCGWDANIIFDMFALFDLSVFCCDITAKLEPRSGGRGASLISFCVAIKKYI